jgi:hypothetical protein
MRAEAMLVEPELKLPAPPPPRGNYMATVQHDSLLLSPASSLRSMVNLPTEASSVGIWTLQRGIRPRGYAP